MNIQKDKRRTITRKEKRVEKGREEKGREEKRREEK